MKTNIRSVERWRGSGGTTWTRYHAGVPMLQGGTLWLVVDVQGPHPSTRKRLAREACELHAAGYDRAITVRWPEGYRRSEVRRMLGSDVL